jgi:pre-mRNA-splicing factor ATP-dependent RNA helicase DHX16
MASSPQSPSFDNRLNESSSSDEQESERSKLSVEELRKKSRYVYLKGRKDKKIQELEEEIADEEYLWKGVKLTKREQENVKFSK